MRTRAVVRDPRTVLRTGEIPRAESGSRRDAAVVEGTPPSPKVGHVSGIRTGHSPNCGAKWARDTLDVMHDGSGDDLVAKQKELIESFFRKASEFTEELLHENERLRTQ